MLSASTCCAHHQRPNHGPYFEKKIWEIDARSHLAYRSPGRPIEPVEGATLLQGDFTEDSVQRKLLDALGGSADLLLSDVSPNRSGNASRDEAAIIEYAERSLELASRCLRPGGDFVCKLLDGAEMKPLLERAKPLFKTSGGLVKPKASRPKSREVCLVARGFDPESFAARVAWT